MKVSEIRTELKKYNSKELENIIIELYQRIPKRKKEEHNIDLLIKDVNYKKKEKLKEENLGFDELQKEMKYFFSCVDEGLYSSPNNTISKSERSGYRFKVKKYYKKLCEIDGNSPDFEYATNLLIELYKRLSKGSNYLLFANWETFRALGVEQVDFLEVIVKRLLYKEVNEDRLKRCIDVLNNPKDPYGGCYDYFYRRFAHLIKDSESRKISVKLLNDIIIENKSNLNGLGKYDRKRYNIEETINHNIICLINLCFDNTDYDEGISYFHKNYIRSNSEVKEYILLEELYERELYEYWIKEYESNKKIKYRESLVSQYNELKKKYK